MAIMKLIKGLLVASLIVLLIACSSETESTTVSIQPSPDIKTTVDDNVQKSLTTNPASQMGAVMSQYKLKSPWDTRIFNNDAPGSKCSNPMGLPIHIPDRLKNDEVDQKAWDAFTNVDNILFLSDEAASKGNNIAASCVLEHLYYWAQNDAFIVNKECSTRSKEHWIHGYDRSNFINGVLAIPYLQIRNDPTLDKSKKATVLSWFEKLYLCSKTRAEGMLLNAKENGLGPHNQTYPALLSVTTTSLVLDKVDEFEWSIKKYKESIATISENGTSPNEIAHKMDWTLHYHTLIINFSVHLSLLGEMNGFTGLFKDPALLRLTKQVLDSYDDPGYLKNLTGYEQTQDPLTTPWNLSWVEHMKRYNTDPRLSGLATQFQWKMDHSHTGGHPEYWWSEYWK